VIRTRSRERGEIGEGEDKVEGVVGEDAIQFGKDWKRLLIDPGEETIGKINLRYV